MGKTRLDASAPGKRVVGNFQVQIIRPVDNTEGGRVFYAPGATIKPSARVLVSLSPSLDLDNSAQQYVTAVSDATVAPQFAGTRYVFGRLQQKTLSMDTRVNMTFALFVALGTLASRPSKFVEASNEIFSHSSG